MSTREATNIFYEDRHPSDIGRGEGAEQLAPDVDQQQPPPQNPATGRGTSSSDDDIYLDGNAERQWRENHAKNLSDEGELSYPASPSLSEGDGAFWMVLKVDLRIAVAAPGDLAGTMKTSRTFPKMPLVLKMVTGK